MVCHYMEAPLATTDWSVYGGHLWKLLHVETVVMVTARLSESTITGLHPCSLFKLQENC
jgi:hypothetical protein